MSDKLFKLVRSFNRRQFLNEKSTIKEIHMVSAPQQYLNFKINNNLDHIKTYKGLLLILDSFNVNLEKPDLVVDKLKHLFAQRALYGFNLNNELFFKFLRLVHQKTLWNEEFDIWLLDYVKNNYVKMTKEYSQMFVSYLESQGQEKSKEGIVYLKQHMEDIENLRKSII